MLSASSATFSITPSKGSRGLGDWTGAKSDKIYSPLKSTVILLESENQRLCFVTTHTIAHTFYLCRIIKELVAGHLKLPEDNVLVFSSHNHCAVPLSLEPTKAFWGDDTKRANPGLTKAGKDFIKALRHIIRKLASRLQPVTVWYALGKEGRITYNRKGRHDDGTTYFMREEDRLLLGRDFKGEIDEDAPVVALRAENGKIVCFITQFTGHPVTAYHPEYPIVYGEWPQVACDILSRHHSRGRTVPVGFLQGCAGNINSKGLLCRDVKRSQLFGRYLGQTYIKASRKLKPSASNVLLYEIGKARVPYRPLPPRKVLLREIAEMKDFKKRALAGDENTRSCVGFNFPKSLSPEYRAALVDAIIPWSQWALRMHDSRKIHTLPKYNEMDVYVIRLGDVGIVGLTGETFMGIGRMIKENSPMSLTIPCGYTNISYGYIPDSPNTGDSEYISSFYRYTRYRPQYKKPGGDVLARTAIRLLRKFSKAST